WDIEQTFSPCHHHMFYILRHTCLSELFVLITRILDQTINISLFLVTILLITEIYVATIAHTSFMEGVNVSDMLKIDPHIYIDLLTLKTININKLRHHLEEHNIYSKKTLRDHISTREFIIDAMADAFNKWNHADFSIAATCKNINVVNHHYPPSAPEKFNLVFYPRELALNHFYIDFGA
ncbi:hypothetical protein ACJX0J_031365, partial [Zea mays]